MPCKTSAWHYTCKVMRNLAADAYVEELSVNPGNAEIHNNWGPSSRRADTSTTPSIIFAPAIGLRPSLDNTHVNLGNALQDRRELGRTAESYAEAVESNPRNAVAHNNLGAALNKLKQAN